MKTLRIPVEIDGCPSPEIPLKPWLSPIHIKDAHDAFRSFVTVVSTPVTLVGMQHRFLDPIFFMVYDKGSQQAIFD